MKRVPFALALFIASAGLAGAETLDVLDAKVKNDPDNGSYGVMIYLSAPSGEIIERLTTGNVGRNMSIELNGKAVWLPVITAPITNRYFLLSNMNKDLAERLASDIGKAGSIGVTVMMPPGG
ncbi:SecDF P1 head subdomain-containing protein [Rhizobium terrae]|uniref:SecDF P1 head subdomain-containing protein n=1 Tax=Rhizobium terrae TaxID=2171756 RepID=UPI0013C2C385|nr:hypothetical protein [Rhizobium terrae]